MVFPLFDYYNNIYGSTDHKALIKLQQLQNNGGKPKDTPTQSAK